MIPRRWLHTAMNVAMTRASERSGISRQYFKVEVEGSRDYAYSVTIGVGSEARIYELNFGDDWVQLLLEDAANGVFGPPREPWLRSRIPGVQLALAR